MHPLVSELAGRTHPTGRAGVCHCLETLGIYKVETPPNPIIYRTASDRTASDTTSKKVPFIVALMPSSSFFYTHQLKFQGTAEQSEPCNLDVKEVCFG